MVGAICNRDLLHLRPARPDDGPALHRICYPHYAPEEMERTLAASLKQAERGRGLRLVAEWEEQIAGCGQLLSWGRGAEIADLVVVPRYRGRGIGRELVEALLEEARRLGIPAVEIGVRPGNQRALALYQRLGFVYQRKIHLTLNKKRMAFVYLEHKAC